MERLALLKAIQLNFTSKEICNVFGKKRQIRKPIVDADGMSTGHHICLKYTSVKGRNKKTERIQATCYLTDTQIVHYFQINELLRF